MSIGFDGSVLLVGGGPVSRADYDFVRSRVEAVVAVDSGFDTLRAWDVVPEAAVGDFDSIRTPIEASVEVVRIDEQNSTDLEKALRTVDAPLLLGIGFLGGRLDHTLAAMHALVTAERSAILIGEADLVFAAPTDWRAEVPEGTRVSFYPVKRVPAVGSKGLRWPLDDLVLEGGRQIGVSNQAVSTRIAAWFAERGIVTILPREQLDAAIESLVP